MTFEHFLELSSRRQSTNDAIILDIVLVLLENIPGTRDENPLLRVSLRAIPPAPNNIWKEYTKQTAIHQQDVFPISFSDDELREGDADTKALFAIGMTVLNVVAANLFIGQRFIGLGDLDEALVKGLYGLVFRGVGLDLVRVVNKREALVVSRDRFLIGTLPRE